MSELADRMRRQLAGRSAEAPHPVAPLRPYPRRITLDLTAEDHQTLKLAAVQHDTTMADLLRGLVAFWRADPVFAQRVYQEHQSTEAQSQAQGHRSTEPQKYRALGPGHPSAVATRRAKHQSLDIAARDGWIEGSQFSLTAAWAVPVASAVLFLDDLCSGGGLLD